MSAQWRRVGPASPGHRVPACKIRPFGRLMQNLEQTIEAAWEQRSQLSPANASPAVREAVEHVIDALDRGELRVAEKRDGAWTTHQWIKKAVLLSFRLAENQGMGAAG